ncbi:IucA/IucC family protein [Allorhizocola rhizosphaerae]|uniref:IucA/IucC family protein n=1 Tax=Allorhizocola rhizosphaerae TaxID=1872709 RepID=UPI000E3BB7DA|nr:IucA/IucC family protein [Allorhizocola rhizosphaerae]
MQALSQSLKDVAKHAPEWEDAFRECHPAAQASVATKLAEALWREDIGDARRRFKPVAVHAFERAVLAPVEADPASLVHHEGLQAELASAVTGLALAYARRQAIDRRIKASGAPDMLAHVEGHDADTACVKLERLATEGHNLHPCGRTRLGWHVGDMLRHDLETDRTEVAFLPGGHPVHAWQLAHLRERYDLETVGQPVPAWPTAALRTLLIRPGTYYKLALDIQVTSTRRTISPAATRNGPVLSRFIADRLDDDRFLLMPETAGMSSPLGTGRDLSAIVRSGLYGRLRPGEVPVPGGALPAIDPITGRTILEGLVERSGLGPVRFVVDYARLLLPAVLRLAARHGIGLEAHLQNCVPTFVDGHPYRMGLRDFAGLRIMAGQAPPLHPGSVIATCDRAVMLSKVAYTVFQAHLGELVLRLGVEEAWPAIGDIAAQALDAHPDLAFYTAETVPHKALTRMRLADAGDIYVPVRNPLHG